MGCTPTALHCLEVDRFPFAIVAASEDSLVVLGPCTVPALADALTIR